ncbi:unnamed protein product [Moneuplotes crassus]|uniref:histidine kinase n=1 Tax=Euplotes crassus TaxID=5936 RepID=A0AAD2D8A8_EUPCR|nr:unnamed protein product [Moneuplotes crassus]
MEKLKSKRTKITHRLDSIAESDDPPDFSKMGDLFQTRPHYSRKHISQDQGDLQDIENFIMEMQVKSFKNKFFQRIKFFCLVFSAALIIMGISIHVYMEDNSSSEIGRNRCIATGILLIVCVGILEYYPERHGIIAPAFLAMTFISLSDIYASSDRYVMHEYALPCIGYGYLIMVLIPSTWQANLIAWIVGISYNLTKVVEKQEEIPTTFWIAILPAMFYYIATSYLLSGKLKELYEYLRNNEVLRNEMTNILEMFPNAVMINPCKPDENETKQPFTNHEFDEKITIIKHKLDELRDIKLSFLQTKGEQESFVKCDLETYLLEIHKRLRNRDIFEQNKVNIISDGPDEDEDYNAYTVKCIKVEWGGRPCFMNVFINNTDIIKLEQATNSIKCQKIMFASASHEFRTPLNAIMNSYGFLKEKNNQVLEEISKLENVDNRFLISMDRHSAQIQKFLKMGSTSSTLLLSLIEDILDLSKMEAGTFSISMCDFKPTELMEEVHEIFTLQSKQRGIQLISQIDKIFKDKIIRSDKGRIKQVLLNLISNSLKFTFKGSITVCAKAKKTRNGNYIQFSVTDTGVGIKKEDQKRLFKLFGMAKSDRGLNPNGCGIGLTVSKRYVEKLGGEIKLSSVYQKGTTTRFIIPLPKDFDIRGKSQKERSSCHSFYEQIGSQEELIKRDSKEESKEQIKRDNEESLVLRTKSSRNDMGHCEKTKSQKPNYYLPNFTNESTVEYFNEHSDEDSINLFDSREIKLIQAANESSFESSYHN